VHTLINAVPTSLDSIEADADKVSQILDNLVGNAIKYSPDGGEVTVGAADEGDSVRIDVSDQGLGIPERHQDKIFDRFQMVEGDSKRKGIKGTGIGLYLVRHLARAHGGDVWLARSETDEGSTFSISLPKVPQIEQSDQA
jgi:two-component system sensor histidine kinase VicK